MHKKIDRVISFYKFTQIIETERTRFNIFNFLNNLDILGTVLIANEGINANICGPVQDIESAKIYIKKLLGYTNIKAKIICLKIA